MRLMRLLYTLTLTTLLAACATTGVNLPRESKVAPVSLVGDSLDFRVVGLTIFGNNEKEIEVANWNTDEHVEATARKILKSGGFLPVQAPSSSKNDIGSLSFFNFTGTYSFSGGKEGLRKVALAAGADYLLIIARAPNAYHDPFFDTNQFITGYGIYQRSLPGLHRGVNYAQLVVLLINAKTGDEIFSRVESQSTPRPESLWLDGDNPLLDAAYLADVRKEVLPIIDDVINKAMINMKAVN